MKNKPLNLILLIVGAALVVLPIPIRFVIVFSNDLRAVFPDYYYQTCICSGIPFLILALLRSIKNREDKYSERIIIISGVILSILLYFGAVILLQYIFPNI